MRIYFILTAILIIVALTLPFVINKTSEKLISASATTLTDTSVVQQSSDPVNETETVKVMRTASDSVIEIDMLEYIIGAVAAEMPASFCFEALKAQAVASYTYAKYIKENTAKNGAVLSDSSFIHQSYIDQSEQKEKWGKSYDEYRSIIEKAVKSVYREYLTYDNKTSMTVFHSLSAEKTNSSEEIWGEAVPYLISVDTKSEASSEEKAKFSEAEFKALFEEKGKINLDEAPGKWAKVLEKNNRGFIRKLSIGNKVFSAIEIMEILSLPSSNFTAKHEDESFIFQVKGKGHGVGMSQYGAEYMARQGKSYKEILAHYYPGTTLSKE